MDNWTSRAKLELLLGNDHLHHWTDRKVQIFNKTLQFVSETSDTVSIEAYVKPAYDEVSYIYVTVESKSVSALRVVKEIERLLLEKEVYSRKISYEEKK